MSLRAGDVVRIRTERWSIVRQSRHGDVSAIDVRGAQASNRGVTARFLLPFEPIEPVAVPATARLVRPAEWRRVARSVLAAATPRIDALRAAADARFDLLPYQLEPALAVTRGLGCRLLIADDVGLGKTVQSGLIVAEILHRTPDARALVVCPAGLRSQWAQELRARFGLEATSLDSAAVSRTAAHFDGSTNPWSVAPLVVASIDFVKRAEVMRALEGLVWDVLVLDEAHNLASRSDRATAAAALASRARTVVMLSATPHSGDDAAFARLCSLGDVHRQFPLVFFRRTRAEAGLASSRRTRWLWVRPSRAEADMHGALVRYADRVWHERRANESARLAVTVLLRRAASSASSLARSLERRLQSLAAPHAHTATQLVMPFVFADDDEEPTGVLGMPALADGEEERQRLEQLLGLARRAALTESKVFALRRWLSRVREPVLVFTEYRDTLTQLRRALASDRVVVELHGAMTPGEREAAEHAFVRGDADILLATDAASEGLNLQQRCRCVINLETPWNPVRLEQRIGRVDRIGQRRRVHAIHLVAADTLEVATVRRVRERASRASEALGSASSDVDTATAVLTGVDVPQAPPTLAASPTLLRPALREVAMLEAARIADARRLTVPAPPHNERPVAARVSRMARHSVVALEVVLADADQMPVWHVLVGVALDCRAATTGRRDLQAIVAALHERAIQGSREAIDQIVRRNAGSWRSAIVVQAAREQAIAAAIRLRHARIAADLLQPGLFDRRAERLAGSQSAFLEEALGRCSTRLEALGRMGAVNPSRPVLRFAVLIP